MLLLFFLQCDGYEVVHVVDGCEVFVCFFE